MRLHIYIYVQYHACKPRSKIFELAGIEVDGATDLEKDEILEAVLAEAEQRFGYERTVEKHPKYQCMTRYLYKVSEGLAETNSTNSVKKVESYAGNLKKGNQLSLELLGKTSSTGSGSSTDQQEVMSDSYKILAEKHKELNSLRSKLRVNSEELELIKTTIASMNDPTWTKKHDEIAKAIEVLQEFLKEVRQQLAEGLPSDKASDCTEKVQQALKINEQCSHHHKATSQIIKHVKALMED